MKYSVVLSLLFASGAQGYKLQNKFATGMNGDEDLAEDITMKGDKFHYAQREFHMSLAQAALGITAILQYVPIEVAVAHQAGSLVLLTMVTGLAHSLKFSRFGQGAAVVAAVSKAART